MTVTRRREDILFCLYSEQDFESRRVVQAILEVLMSGPAFLRPIYFGHNAANQRIAKLEDVVDALVGNDLREDAAGRPRLGGAVFRPAPYRIDYQLAWSKTHTPKLPVFFGSFRIKPLESFQSRIADICQLLKKLANVMDAVYGEVRNLTTPYSDVPIDLFTRLPDIPAICIYGRPYIQMFGEKTICKAPFTVIERLAGRGFWLQSVSSVLDPVPEGTKAAIRLHFGADAFMSGGKFLYRTGRAPRFATYGP